MRSPAAPKRAERAPPGRMGQIVRNQQVSIVFVAGPSRFNKLELGLHHRITAPEDFYSIFQKINFAPQCSHCFDVFLARRFGIQMNKYIAAGIEQRRKRTFPAPEVRCRQGQGKQ